MISEISNHINYRCYNQGMIYMALFCLLSGYISFVIAQECSAVPTNIVSWWTGDGDAYDRISGQYGSMVNGVTFESGKVGQAFRFNGIRGCIDCGDLNAVELENGTYEMWFMTEIANSGRDPLNSYQALISKMYQGSLRARKLILENARTIKFEIYDQSQPGSFVRIYTRPVEFEPGEWHHVAATWGETGMKIYLDGVLNDSSEYTGYGYSSELPFVIGNLKEDFNTGREYGFYGMIDEISIYERALTAQEIKSIYDAGSAGKCKIELPNPIINPKIHILDD